MIMSSVAGSVTELGPATRKKGFKKSRRGCRTCKERKIKCDEKHPLCGNCARRFVNIEKCDFDVFVNPVCAVKAKSRGQSCDTAPCAISNLPTGIDGSSSCRFLELRLMHHYSTFTCAQLPDGHELRARQLWAVDIPQRGFKCELVLNAILAISAQHLWALTPNDPSLAVASRSYFDKAVRSHRQELARPDRQTAESLLATAILLTHHTWVASHSVGLDEPYVLPLQTYHMARGIQSLFNQMFPWLKGSGYLWYAEQQSLIDESGIVCRNEFLQSGLEDLDELSTAFERDDGIVDDQAIYRQTVIELSSMYSSISTGAPQFWLQRRVATMPLRLPSRFLDLLELHDAVALALLARNIVLLKMIDPAWWLHGAGVHGVAEHAIQGIEGLLPVGWRWTMEWPWKVLNGDIDIAQERGNETLIHDTPHHKPQALVVAGEI